MNANFPRRQHENYNLSMFEFRLFNELFSPLEIFCRGQKTIILNNGYVKPALARAQKNRAIIL